MTVTRDYGETAQEADELLTHLLGAILSVARVLALPLGWRAALVVFLSVPVSPWPSSGGWWARTCSRCRWGRRWPMVFSLLVAFIAAPCFTHRLSWIVESPQPKRLLR